MKSSIASTFMLLATVGQTAACQSTIVSPENNKSFNASQAVFQIAADTVPCTKGGPVAQPVQTQCLVVNGETFYEDIEGYDHQEGVGRTLKIARTQICDPDVFNSCPQDTVSIYSYRFLEIISAGETIVDWTRDL